MLFLRLFINSERLYCLNELFEEVRLVLCDLGVPVATILGDPDILVLLRRNSARGIRLLTKLF